MLEADHIRVESSSLDSAEVLGAEICELEAGWDVDGGRIANGLLLVRVAGVGSNMPNPACRVRRVDDLDGGLAILVDWDGALDF